MVGLTGSLLIIIVLLEHIVVYLLLPIQPQRYHELPGGQVVKQLGVLLVDTLGWDGHMVQIGGAYFAEVIIKHCLGSVAVDVGGLPDQQLVQHILKLTVVVALADE